MKPLFDEVYTYGLVHPNKLNTLLVSNELGLALYYALHFKLDDVDAYILELGEIIKAELEDETSF